MVGIDWQSKVRLKCIKYRTHLGTAPAPVLIDYKRLNAGEHCIRGEQCNAYASLQVSGAYGCR